MSGVLHPTETGMTSSGCLKIELKVHEPRRRCESEISREAGALESAPAVARPTPPRGVLLI